MDVERYEVIFPMNRDHSETCPVCVTDTPEGEDDPIMVRRSPDVYQCEQCGLLILAGKNRYKMSVRIVLGRVCDEVELAHIEAPSG